jgi:hypothetical protein
MVHCGPVAQQQLHNFKMAAPSSTLKRRVSTLEVNTRFQNGCRELYLQRAALFVQIRRKYIISRWPSSSCTVHFVHVYALRAKCIIMHTLNKSDYKVHVYCSTRYAKFLYSLHIVHYAQPGVQSVHQMCTHIEQSVYRISARTLNSGENMFTLGNQNGTSWEK